jgi:antitoxin component YwqK of YwqJK toxin-antitoxin module
MQDKIMRSLHLAGVLPLVLLATSCARQSNQEVCVVDQKYVHKYGVEVPSEFWSASGEHGSVISRMDNGIVITRTYASGTLDGDSTFTYAHSSQIQKREIYSQGTLVKEIEYYFDGTPRAETTFDSPIGIKTVSTWYLSGTPRSVEQYSGGLVINGEFYNANNQKDAFVQDSEGTRLVRDDYGQLVATDDIKGGQLIMRTTYHHNGSPKEKISYNNGQIDGQKFTFHPAGEPDSLEEWSNGQQHGLTTIYLHGQKYAEVPYVADKRQGIERHYRDGKDSVQEISWQNGKLHGPSTTYVGDTSKSEWYYMGQPTSQSDYEFMTSRPVIR